MTDQHLIDVQRRGASLIEHERMLRTQREVAERARRRYPLSSQPLSAEEIEELREYAARDRDDLDMACTFGMLRSVVATLDASIEERDELQESLNEAESYAAEGWKWLDDALAALGVKTVFEIPKSKS
jgi:hypothetical protein